MAENENSHQRKFVLGIDLGTTTVKASLLDAEDGKVVKSLSRPTKATVPSDFGSSGHEQDPQKILTALQFCVSGFPKEDQLKVQSIGISGQMHGVLFWKNGEAWHRHSFGRFDCHVPSKTSHLFTWEDQRSTGEFLGSLPKPASHLRLATGQGCPTIFWLRRNRPCFLDHYDCAGTIQDFVVSMLCELPKPLMSPQNAASWGYFNTETNTWNTDILKGADFPVHFLPEVCGTNHVAGQLKSAWYSIPVGTQVMVALGDLQCSILSSLQRDKDAVLNLSTSAQLSFPTPHGFSPPPPDPASPIEYFPYFGGHYIAVAASLTGGNAMAAFVSMLQQWTHEFGNGIPESQIWERLMALGLECPESDLVVTPTLHGERHLPQQKASVSGITTANLSLGSVYRAMCKGIVTNLHAMMPSAFLKSHHVQRIVGTGSALTRNPVIKEEIQKAFDIPIVYGNGNDAAVGAAMVTIKTLKMGHV